MTQKFNSGDLVTIAHSYEHQDFEGAVGMIIGMTEIEFEDEQGNETIDLFDVHCGDEILQCYSDDLTQVKDKKYVSSACPPGNKTRVREQLRRVVSYTFKTNTK